MSYSFKSVFKTHDSEVLNRVIIILEYYKMHPHLIEEEGGIFEIEVPEKNFEICKSIVTAVENSKFDIVDMELNSILTSKVSIEGIEKYMSESKSIKRDRSKDFLSPKRLLWIYLLTFGMFTILTVFITLIRR